MSSKLFLGKKLHWLLWLVLFAVLFALGKNSFHVRYFVPFCFILLGLTSVAVFTILSTSAVGERITREPLEVLDDADG